MQTLMQEYPFSTAIFYITKNGKEYWAQTLFWPKAYPVYASSNLCEFIAFDFSFLPSWWWRDVRSNWIMLRTSPLPTNPPAVSSTLVLVYNISYLKIEAMYTAKDVADSILERDWMQNVANVVVWSKKCS